MSEELLTLRPIAHIHTQFPEKFGIPRQSCLVEDLRARVVFEREYWIQSLPWISRSGFSTLWLLWQFTESRVMAPTVRPRSGQGTTMGGSLPVRPSPSQSTRLSCVKLEGVDYDAPDGPALLVRGADLLDGTPILDVKPYVPLADCRPDAKGSFSDDHREDRLFVDIPPALLEKVAQDLRPALLGVLSQDPRPSYQKDPERVYGMAFAGMEIKFTVDGDTLHVIEIAQA